MKIIVLVSLLFASLVSPQGSADADSNRVVATADAVSREGNTIHLRGHVEVRHGRSLVTADRADLPARVELDDRPANIMFEGHVSMTIDGVAPLAVVRRQ